MDLFDLKKWKKFPKFLKKGEFSSKVDQIAIDSRQISSQNSLFVALPGKSFDGHLFVERALRKGAKFAVVKEGFSSSLVNQALASRLIEVKEPLYALQEIASAYRFQKKCQLVAIGGAYGKTMVKDLLFLILQKEIACTCSPESFNSQIGVPLSLLEITKKDKIAVIETAASRPGEMAILASTALPSSVVITPFGDKHLLSMGTRDTMVDEYLSLALHETVRDWILLPSFLQDHPRLRKSPAHLYFWDEEDRKTPFVRELPSQDLFRQNFLIDFYDGEPQEISLSCRFHYTGNLLNMAIKAAFC